MAIGWYDSLKDIPWTKALSVAPALAERGRSLWGRVTTRAEKTVTAPPAGAESIAALEVRYQGLEKRVAQQHEELVASFEVVQALAEQHSEMVRAVDLLLARTRVLLRVCALLGAAIVALLLLVALR